MSIFAFANVDWKKREHWAGFHCGSWRHCHNVRKIHINPKKEGLSVQIGKSVLRLGW